MEFTQSQQQIIDSRQQNIIVSAAAGSGKTAVLTERIARKICGSEESDAKLASIERMLIVTFTKAAAREMRERIGKRLREELEKQPDNVRIRKQIAILHTAQITTIDSFCLNLVRNHFEEIGLDPSFKIGMEEDTTPLADKAFMEAIEEGFLSQDSEFKNLIECYAPMGRMGELKDIIKIVANKAASKPYPFEWLKSLIMSEQVDPTQMEYMQFVVDYENTLLKAALEAVNTARSITAGTELKKHHEAAGQIVSFIDGLMDTDQLEDRTRKIHSLETVALKYGSKKFDPDTTIIKDQAKQLMDFAKSQIDKLAKAFHENEFKQEMELVKNSFKQSNAIVKLTMNYMERFAELKREAGFLDFSDMEHLALKILVKDENGKKVPTDTALKYRQYFDEIMIDEYQDSNEIQETILSIISREDSDDPNRFMVGDVKQSIYRFRLANPQIFLDKYKDYDKDNERSIKIDLSTNFRSRKEIVDSVNSIFEKCMMASIGGVEYTEDARLYLGANYPEIKQDNKSEVLIFKNSKRDTGLNEKEYEARVVANRIKQLFAENFMVSDLKTGEKRPIRFSDIAILLRNTNNKDSIYLNELKKAGIPAYVISKKGYFGTTEVSLIMSLLSIIDNPRQDMPLFAVLKSFIGGFSDDEIAVIRIKQGRSRLIDSLMKYSENGADDRLKDKVSLFLKELDEFRKQSAYTSAADMLEKIFNHYDYIAMVQSLPGGEQRAANMKLLQDSVYSFEEEGKFGIHDFVKHIETLMAKEFDMGEATTLSENDNVVRIMTIHKSKGLEYPVCFVSSLGTTFNNKSSRVEINDDFNIGTESFDMGSRVRQDTILKKSIHLKNSLDELGEEIRVLYVALTRAKEKLILTGQYEDKNVVENYGPAALYGAKCFMDIIYPIVKQRPDVFYISEIGFNEIDYALILETMDRKASYNKINNIAPNGSVKEYKYPNTSLDSLFTKTTVSELKKAAYLEREDGENTLYHEEEIKIPRFIKDNSSDIGGAMRGTAYHRVMELMDFKNIYSYEDINEGLLKHRQKMIEDMFIDKEMDELVGQDRILKFLNTDLSKRMGDAAKNNQLYLEQPFVLSVNAKTVREEFPESEQILVQGVIDVYFEENNELVLMDYKTDRVNNAKELVDRYKTQLDYYSEALSRLEKKPVKEIFIYSFALGEVIDVNNPAFIDKSSK